MRTGRARRWLGGLAAALLVLDLGVAASRSDLQDPPQTLLVRDRSGAFLGELGDPSAEGVGYWRVDPLPERVVAATLALEDRRFRSHPGVDPVGVARAIRQNLAAGEVVSGASTVAMQVARMQDPGTRSLPNKVVEATTALLLTARHGRDAVLAQYLRLAPYGNGIHGIAYAARRYLDKPVQDLSWAETAFLCALPQAPSRTNPFDPAGRARAVARAHRILDVLAGQGLLDEAALAQARLDLDALRVPPKDRRPPEAMHALLRLGAELDRDAPLVVSSLDLELQRTLTALTREQVGAWEADGAGNAALVLVDRATWEVRAYVGSTDYFDDRHAGSIDYARVPRNPGSTLKPFFYAAALDRGIIGPLTILDDLGRAASGVENADGSFLGPMLPRRALANSRNVPAVEVLDRLGVGNGWALLRDAGLHADETPMTRYGLGLAVGALPVRLDALTEAYTALAGDGRRQALRWRAGEGGAPGARLVGTSAAREVGLWLSDPLARMPSFPRMGATEYPFPVAVKTGTSPDYRDSWAMAWTDRWLLGVWVGHPDNQPMRRLSGFRGAATLAHTVLAHLHADQLDGLADGSLPAPEGSVAVRVCPLTGQLAGPHCGEVVTERVAPGAVPHEGCGAHRLVRLDRRTGLPATADTPRAQVEERAVVDLPARYAGWLASAGLGAARPAVTAGRDDPPVLRVVSPRRGEVYTRDREAPADSSTIALRAEVEPAVEQVAWYVDGEVVAVVGPPYEARWALAPGHHLVEARVPYTPWRSERVAFAGR